MMKGLLLSLTIIFCTGIAWADNDTHKNTVETINTGDTVVYDLSQAVVGGGYVTFPVYILSDDTIVALDFTLQFNLHNLTYDTITRLVNYLSPSSNYTAADTTVHFSSYYTGSTSGYAHNTPLVQIKFRLLAGPICASDLNILTSLLNGDPCSYKVVGCIPTSITDFDQDVHFNIYPNPSNGKLHVETRQDASVELIDLEGRIVLRKDRIKEFDVSNLDNGIYTIKVYSEHFVSFKKVVVNK